MLTQTQAAELVKKCYEKADFSEMFPLMEADYEHISFWVLEILRGKERAQEYYAGKSEAIRSGRADAQVTGRLVRITEAPDKVRPKGLYRGGVRIPEDPAFLHRSDAGKTAVLLKQYSDHEKKDIHTLAIPTVSTNGLLQQVLIANPDFYGWEDME